MSVGLLERHDPAGGLVVVHPTPGLSGLAAIAHDVLAALGRSIRRLKAERLVGSAQAGRAVVAWLLADQIEDLVVLRADRLSAAGWNWLLAVCRRTGTRLLLICHVQAVPPALADVLEGATHEIVTDLRRALPDRRAGRVVRRRRSTLCWRRCQCRRPSICRSTPTSRSAPTAARRQRRSACGGSCRPTRCTSRGGPRPAPGWTPTSPARGRFSTSRRCSCS